MKRLFSILLALVLCLCCCAALAEGEKVKITIVDSDGVTVLNEFEIAKGEAVTDIGWCKGRLCCRASTSRLRRCALGDGKPIQKRHHPVRGLAERHGRRAPAGCWPAR